MEGSLEAWEDPLGPPHTQFRHPDGTLGAGVQPRRENSLRSRQTLKKKKWREDRVPHQVCVPKASYWSQRLGHKKKVQMMQKNTKNERERKKKEVVTN